MAVTYAAAVKSARMTATRDHFQNGTLEIQASDNTVLATFTLTASAGTITGAGTDEWTLAFVAGTVSAGNTGTANKAVIKTSGGVARITGLTVALSAADIILDNLSINSGQNVQITSAKITHAT